MNRIERRLSEALEERAQTVRPSPGAWVENQRRLARDRRRRRTSACVAAAAAVVVTVGLVQILPLGRPAEGPLYGLSVVEAQRFVDGCILTGDRKDSQVGKLPEPVSAYRPVFGVRDLYEVGGRKMTLVVAKAKGPLALSCLGQVGGSGRLRGLTDLALSAGDRPKLALVSTFYNESPGDWRAVAGLYRTPVARVTVQYQGEPERDAKMANGVWAYGGDGYDDLAESERRGAPVIRAYDGHGRLVLRHGGEAVDVECREVTGEMRCKPAAPGPR